MKYDNTIITETKGIVFSKVLNDSVSFSENASTNLNAFNKTLSDSLEIDDTLNSVYKIISKLNTTFLRTNMP